ncbi:MAG: PDZ domain-containing protein [SAR202 cluster bacterium]|nr:hypothetical protein [Chloroflexota bacterium]MDP6420735.1 PDZ domain-containing protein [SAR202 cluster bacterium]HAL49037.1 hypothetical protein [Dehalococcoidia bacterium]MDP6665385.1 PDZ domain-containing protein [SAR202 cluster bacterium]MDP6800105.1 PDZ domain-containing protein [SAR202 cluster bacterium]
MGTDQDSSRLRQTAVEMASIEQQIEDAFDRWLGVAQAHSEAAAALTGYKSMAVSQRAALLAHIDAIDGSAAGSDIRVISSLPVSVPHDSAEHAVSAALLGVSSAFNHAAFGYAMLHTAAHRFFDTATADLAEQHRLAYAEAYNSIHRLIPDVVIWEMGDGGQCRCTCPSCGLGICLCWHGHAGSPAPVSLDEGVGVRVRQPNPASAALAADVRQGDVILVANGAQVETLLELQAQIRDTEPGQAVCLQVERDGLAAPMEIAVTRPG